MSQSHVTCSFCKSGPLEKIAYLAHILGKRHQKNLKSKNQPPQNDVQRRSVHITGFDARTPAEAILGAFWPHRIRDHFFNNAYAFIEFDTIDIANTVLKGKFSIGQKVLKVSPKRGGFTPNNESPAIVLSKPILQMIQQKGTPNEVHQHILALINEIELKPNDYECREYLRKSMVDFMMPIFPRTLGYVFGSSANNLGFVGCDVDLYMDLGVDPWAGGNKAEMEGRASDLTFYLAKEIRRSGMGKDIRAVARARVPIVKFIHIPTGLHVDLSFKHGMPVYNTALICQYSRTHNLVRPYLMVIRYWAKVQEVSGGGQPSTLITNYAFTMLMLFVLMSRTDPIVPSVNHLQRRFQGRMAGQCIVGGWDCGFGRQVTDWTARQHMTTVMELIIEFFEFYGKFDAEKWMVCPLSGFLIEKVAIRKKDHRALPPCLDMYCRHNVDIQIDTPLCLQDPFEHSHNITRGLRDGPLNEFQLKCRKAAAICKNILEGKDSLQTLLQPIEISKEDHKEIVEVEEANGAEADKSQEIITLDDSDADTSQDSITILELPQKENENIADSPKAGTSMATDVKEKDLHSAIMQGDAIEICAEVINGTCDQENVSNGLGNNKQYLYKTASDPDQKLHKFVLDFSTSLEFTITVDGQISGGKQPLTREDDIGQAACSLIQFILQQCLKIDTNVVDGTEISKKRKSEAADEDTESGKRMKDAEGEAKSVSLKYRRVTQYDCTAESQLWIGRRRVTKNVPVTNTNPLQHEMAITEVQLQSSYCKNEDNGLLKFFLTIWQENENPSRILVTADSQSNERITRGQLIPMYVYLASISQSMMRRILHYVSTTSSKR